MFCAELGGQTLDPDHIRSAAVCRLVRNLGALLWLNIKIS